MFLIDTHTHLYAEEFESDRHEAIERCLQNGITKLCLPNVDSDSITPLLKLEEDYPGICYAMMGIHPCSVNENFEFELETIKSWLDKRNFVAIGEIGMDLYWDKTFLNEQAYCLEVQINLALKYQLPIVIHCRNAFDELFSVLSKFSQLPKGIFHCFSGDYAQAKQIIELGNFKLGIGGVLTFKNSGLEKVVEQINLEHLVLETDSPYLAPVPFRGKRNESSYLKLIAEKMASVKKLPIEEVIHQTTQNALSILNLN